MAITLRQRRPNASNREELLQLMEQTRSARRIWIEESQSKPSITEIIKTYPRFIDMNESVSKLEGFENQRNIFVTQRHIWGYVCAEECNNPILC